MKKLIFLIILSMFLKNVETKAQIPNGDFEALLYDGTLSNWGNITLFAVIIDSAGNTIQDSLIFDGPFCGVTTDAHSGNYALEMRRSMDGRVLTRILRIQLGGHSNLFIRRSNRRNLIFITSLIR